MVLESWHLAVGSVCILSPHEVDKLHPSNIVREHDDQGMR